MRIRQAIAAGAAVAAFVVVPATMASAKQSDSGVPNTPNCGGQTTAWATHNFVPGVNGIGNIVHTGLYTHDELKDLRDLYCAGLLPG